MRKILQTYIWASLVAQMVKCLLVIRDTQVRSLGQEDPLEKEMETHSNISAWKIQWTEEPGGLHSMGSRSRTRLSNFTFTFFLSYNPKKEKKSTKIINQIKKERQFKKSSQRQQYST